MLILSRVCAEFFDRTGAKIFSVTPQDRLIFRDAPEAIREDPLFQMLLKDRLIEITDNGPRQKQLENDPLSEPKPANPSGTAAARKPAAKSAT